MQLPLPNHIDTNSIISSIVLLKSVDGFHPENVWSSVYGYSKGLFHVLQRDNENAKYYKISLKGKHVVVLGRSNIVGRPISILTSHKSDWANSTTTICHSGTKDISLYTQNADVIIVAMGVPEFLKKDMIRENAIIIDVGINRIKDNSEKGYSLVGDVHWDDVIEKASAITPVPGGVGPMTIAMLIENTIEAAEVVSMEKQLHCQKSSKLVINILIMKFIFNLLIFFNFLFRFAAEYFVANSYGNDDNNGTSLVSPI